LTYSPTLLYSVYVIVAHPAIGSKKNSSSLLSEAGGSIDEVLVDLRKRWRSRCHAMSVPTQIETSVHIERHYAVAEIAELWNLSPDKVRELFENEPGVLVIGERSPRHKRRYVTLRIPQKVLERVHDRLSSKSGVR
jgi:hypothetical protein